MRVFFLVPVFNEARNLALLADNLRACLPACEKVFVFVDDCSTDDTVALLKSLFATTSLEVLEKSENQGPGDSFNRGFEWILGQSASDDDIVVTLEGDNTSDLGILPNMVAISRLGFSLVLASVYAEGGGFSRTSLFRRIISLGANLLLRFVFDIKVLTLSSFYRVYHVTLLRAIKRAYQRIIAEKGFVSMVEILVKAKEVSASVIEVPMVLSFEKRQGASKMRVLRTMGSYLRFLLGSRKLRRRDR